MDGYLGPFDQQIVEKLCVSVDFHDLHRNTVLKSASKSAYKIT